MATPLKAEANNGPQLGRRGGLTESLQRVTINLKGRLLDTASTSFGLTLPIFGLGKRAGTGLFRPEQSSWHLP